MRPPFDPAIKKGRPGNKPRIVVFCPALLVVLGSGVRFTRVNMCCAGRVLVTPGPGFRALLLTHASLTYIMAEQLFVHRKINLGHDKL